MLGPSAARQYNQGMPVQYILHADLDAFYASVEQLDKPELGGKAVLVGGRPASRGVVASCSYEARAHGVHSAMPMAAAVRRCPDGVIVAPRFRRYQKVSEQVMEVLHSFTPLVEPISLDEAFLDVTHLKERGMPLSVIGARIRECVKERTGLTISVGIATSKSVAKIASDQGKPDGLVAVERGQERRFLAPLPVKRLWGVGPRTEERLATEGIATLGDLAARTEPWAERRFGKRGAELIALSRGVDPRPVVTEHEVKSISAETTFDHDLSDSSELSLELSKLCLKVAMRLTREDARGRTVTVKLRLADFTTFTRSETLPGAVADAASLQRTAQRLLTREVRAGRAFRLLGVGVSNFSEAYQMSLLGEG